MITGTRISGTCYRETDACRLQINGCGYSFSVAGERISILVLEI